MAQCAVCGTRNGNDSTFCAACGARMMETSRATVSTLIADPPARQPLAPPPPVAAPVPPPVIARPSRRSSGTHPFKIYNERTPLTVPLLPTFRFIHEPVGPGSAVQFVGRRNEMESLAERILFSEGGSFLVTGYRGVGKTSFVNQVIRKLDRALAWATPVIGETQLIDIALNVARPVQPSEIMHHIIRRLHDRLIERDVYRLLDPDVRRALSIAYHRTSLNMARQVGESSERSYGVNEASIGGDLLKAAMKVTWNAKRTRSMSYETSFLGYDDKAAEHDVITISRRLAAGYMKPLSSLQAMWRMVRRAPPPRVRLKIVFVFDELDKLEEFTVRSENGEIQQKPAIDEILGALKNLFTTSGVSFIFVAGKDLQERWLDDVGRGDSVYESVFAYDKYLPCLWSDVGTICDGLVDATQPLASDRQQMFEAFKKYLAYRGRGIPRRIIRTFNEYVEWNRDRPALAFTYDDARRIRFFAGLQDVVDAHQRTLFGESHEEIAGTLSDRRRLGVYYLIDWILRQGTGEFTLKDVLAASRKLSARIALADEIAPRVAEDIVELLLHADYIQLAPRNRSRVIIGSANIEGQKRYRVTPRRLVEMGGRAGTGEISLVFGVAPNATLAQRDRVPSAIGRFRVVREVGRGGMGVVYEAVDEWQGQHVAIKVLSEPLANDHELTARFEREAMILRALDHPNVVHLRDDGTENGLPYIVMEFLDGVTLEEILRRRCTLDLSESAALIRPVIEAIRYVHEQGFVRNDIKPNNIMLTATGRVCVLDFGISRPRDASAAPETSLRTQRSIVIGTPQFMAPEQFTSSRADERCDVYSLGVVLYRMLTGEYPFSGEIIDAVRARVARTPPPPSHRVPVPPAVDTLVLTCLAFDPDARYQNMSELAEAVSRAFGATAPVDLVAMVRQVREVGKAIDALDRERTAAIELPDAEAARAGGWTEFVFAEQQPAAGAAAAYEPPTTLPSAPLTPAWATVTGAAPPAPAAPAISALGPSRAPTPPPGTFKRAASGQRMRLSPPDPGTVPRPYLALVAGRSELVVSRIGAALSVFPLQSRAAIGRSSENDIVLRETNVSRYHAILSSEGDRWFVEDCNSGLGTSVGGERLTDRRELADGDEIEIGEFSFLVRMAWPNGVA